MFPIRKGAWTIRSVHVNSQPTMEENGFHKLYVSNNEIQIEPAGISFAVNQATSKSAVLESRSQIFFADFVVNHDDLIIKLSRPSFAEKISIRATFEPVAASAPNFA